MRESGEELPQGAIQDGSTHSREGPFLRFQMDRGKAREAKYVYLNLTFLYLYLTAKDRIGSRDSLAEIFSFSHCIHFDVVI